MRKSCAPSHLLLPYVLTRCSSSFTGNKREGGPQAEPSCRVNSMAARGSLGLAGEMWPLEMKLVIPNHVIDEGTWSKEGGWQMQDHTAKTLGEVATGECSSISGLQPLLVPSSQEVCLECWRDLSQRECPLPRPWGEEGPPLGGECGFRISFQPHRSCLWCPLPSSPVCPKTFSNPAADLDQSVLRGAGGPLVQWLKSGQTWIPGPAGCFLAV